MISFEHVTKRYGDHDALQDFSLEVPEGSAFALVGANGAGKTTAIKVLMNLVQPTRGRVRVLGTESLLLSSRERARIGYVSENQKLPEPMTVGEYLAYLRPFYSTWDRELEQQLLRRFRLPQNRKIGALSHGMRLKMALACALPFKPTLLVLDEPFSGLDPLTCDDLVETLIEQAGDVTVLISSHELSEIETFITHVGFMNAGKLLFHEPVADLSSRMRSVQVTLARPPPASLQLPPEWLQARVIGNVLGFVDTRFSEAALRSRLGSLLTGIQEVDVEPLGLRRTFTTLARAAQEQEPVP